MRPAWCTAAFRSRLVICGFIATGAVIGARFRGTSLDDRPPDRPGRGRQCRPGAGGLRHRRRPSAPWLLGLPFGQLWLAYAPGGVEAMAAMALALSLDPAFVGAHHVLRILGLNAVSASWLRRQPRRPTS